MDLSLGTLQAGTPPLIAITAQFWHQISIPKLVNQEEQVTPLLEGLFFMPHRFLLVSLATLPLAVALAHTAPPAPAHLVQEVYATGVQIYKCESGEQGPAWIFKSPEAELANAQGQIVGTHFAGPSWKNNDGSLVGGEVVAKENAPKAGDIPWLLLKAKSHEGSGAWSGVAYVQRTATSGGVAPKDGCEAARAGQELRVPYKATYQFYAE